MYSKHIWSYPIYSYDMDSWNGWSNRRIFCGLRGMHCGMFYEITFKYGDLKHYLVLFNLLTTIEYEQCFECIKYSDVY